MKVISVINAFPENSITIGRFKYLVNNPEFDYRVFCWDSNKYSWAFWGKQFSRQQQKKVMVSGASKLMSYKIVFELFNIISFILRKPVLFSKHYSYFRGKGIKKYIHAIFDDYKILDFTPDIIHFEFGTLGAKKIYLKEIVNCKAVVSFRGFDLNYYRLNDEAFYSKVWQQADAFHFLGEDLLKRAIKRGYKNTGNYYLIPPAIDTAFFKKELLETSASQAMVIISVGRLVWKKAIDFGLLAFKRFLDLGGDGTYHIIGTGPSYEQIQFTAFELGIEDKVILHGKLTPENTKTLLGASDVFLHPAVSEGFGNAVIEAQAMELPVVCTNADGLGENVEDGKTGFVVDKWDYNSMGDKLFDLFNDKEERKQMGINGRKRVVEKFKEEDQVKKFEDLYKSLK